MKRGFGDKCWLLTVAWLCVGAITVLAQTSKPVSFYDDRPIRRTAAEPTASTKPAIVNQTGRGQGILDFQRVAMALAIVIGLVIALRWLARRWFPNVTGARAAGVVRVLTKSPVTPKQQLLLVQVGRRIIVAADNGAQLSALSEISDPDEVASLLGQLNGPESPAKEAFAATLGDAKREFEPAPVVEPSPPDPTHGELASLAQKVRLLAQQLGK